MAKAKIELLELANIIRDPRLQCRAKFDEEVVDEYVEIINNDGTFEGRKPVVFRDPVTKEDRLSDGWHRDRAYAKAGKTAMFCEVIEGDFNAAFEFACGANATHGKARTREDIKNALFMFFDKYPPEVSTHEAARVCKVSLSSAQTGRKEWEKARGKTRSETVIGKNGVERKVSTTKKVDTSDSKKTNDQPVVGKDGKVQPETGQVRECAVDVAESTGSESRPMADRVANEADNEPAKPKDETLRDAKGRPVPAGLVNVFTKAKRYTTTVADLGRLISEIKGWTKEPDGMFIATQSLEITGQNFQSEIATSRPYIVCPACDGTTWEAAHPGGKPCKLCRADGKPQGWLPHGKWAGLSVELKQIAQSHQEETE